MSTKDRRKKILEKLEEANSPLSASLLAKDFGVSRQIIVGDIALLRAEDIGIISTNRGYILNQASEYTRVINVSHDEKGMRDELNAIVDYGGRVLDVIVNHPIYGEIRVDLNISNRLDVEKFISDIKNQDNVPLSVLTKDKHSHTIEAKSEENLDFIERKLKELDIIK
ncbi:MAG: transcription repressor NadR [Peptostreptococcus sp.]|uniref:transcription repressor NadR n=1 Tax=Peptostreptococcus sp. TaxID=1262 RepID=UPI002FC8861E